MTPTRSRRHASSRHKLHRAVLEALETRTLMSQTWTVGDTGNASTNGVNLSNILKGTTLQGGLPLALGDTIILTAGATYQAPASSFVLRNLTSGSGTITIETDHLANLPAGTRVSPSQTTYMATLTTPGSNAAIVKTNVNAHDFTFIGLEFVPKNQTDSFTNGLLLFGDGTTNQSLASQVPQNFIVDRCYIHGLDNPSPTTDNNYKNGISLNSFNTTVENSYISDIHNNGQDAQAIGGFNGTGNYLITNNFLEATGENILFGGADTHIANNTVTNVTVTHNYFYKRLSWDPFSSQWDGHQYSVKNLLEFKMGINVFVDSNLLENCWVGADQVGPGILFTPVNQGGTNTWTLVANCTVTNNIIKNVGEGFQLGLGKITSLGYTQLPAHDITIRNNLVFNDSAGATGGVGVGFAVSVAPVNPSYNVTIDHNTVLNSSDPMTLDSSSAAHESVFSQNFTVTNNLFQYGDYGLFSTAGEGLAALNTYASGIWFSNQGSGYTSAPTVTFVGGLGPGGVAATGTVTRNGSNNSIFGITLNNIGSGYTSAPTIVFNGGGGTGAAASALSIQNGTLSTWTFDHNLTFGMGSAASTTQYPSGNFYSNTEDTVNFKDPAGELAGLLSNSAGHNAASDGTDIGASFSGFSGIADFVPVDNALTGYWKFDEGSGTTTADSSGNGKTATLNGSASWSTSGQSFDAVSMTGGNTANVSIPTFSTTSTFSFAAWVKPSSFSATQYIASTGNSAFSLSINTSGKLVATGKTGSVTSSATMTAGTWYLVGVTFDGATLKVYQNGVAVGSVAATTATGSTTLYLGGNGGSTSSLNGSLDEARYYNTPLTTTNLNGNTGMQQLYNNFGPLIGVVNPAGGNAITTSTTTLTVSAVTHQDANPGAHNSPSDIIYTWSAYSGPGTPTFSASNGTHSAGAGCTVTWAGSGIYVLKLVVTDGVGDSSTVYRKYNVTGLGAVPTAPSNVAANPGTSTIAVSWTDNSTNETSFDVQRSSDGGANWSDLGNVASATGSGSTVTYTDTTALNDGTAYLYQVASFNGGGDSNFIGLANGCAVACPIAYEGFNYSTGNWSGGNTGVGFATAWSVTSSTNATIQSGSLTYTNNGHALTTANNQLKLVTNNPASATLASTVGNAGTSLWVGFEFANTSVNTTVGLYSEVQIGSVSGSNVLRLGAQYNSAIDGKATVSGTDYYVPVTTTVVSGTTYFVVYKIDYLTTGDVITLWVNPQPGGASPTNYTATASKTLPATAQLNPTTSITLTPNNGFNPVNFDEIRLGLSYAAVAPDPLVLHMPTYTPSPSIHSPFTIPNSPFASHALFQSFLATAPVTSVQTFEPSITPPTDYHYEGDGSSTSYDLLNPEDLRLSDVLLA